MASLNSKNNANNVFHCAIVIPCYNEGKNFLTSNYRKFLSIENETLLCFVNDGSTDNTGNLLSELQDMHKQNVVILDLLSNGGKAAAVREGILHCLEHYQFEHIAYLDADLAVSLEECMILSEHLNEQIHCCFGSRMARVGSTIERKWYRFLIGRVIATCISLMLDLKVYDTQCGCKWFTRELAARVAGSPFLSKWLFDVEIFFRMYEVYGKGEAVQRMLEIPLVRWVDRGDSKVKFTYVFRLARDLNRIRKRYRHTKTQ